MRLALIGYGHVGMAFAQLLERKRAQYPFRIIAIHTARRGSAFNDKGLPIEPAFGPAAASVEEFLDRARPEVAIEITTLQPASGEPAISHIRAAFARQLHVITANKGPNAFAYQALCAEARRAGVEYRYESTVMDGTPVFNMVRNNLPGLKILGFAGVLNSTSRVVIQALHRGLTMAEGIAEAQRQGIAEADASFDIDGWDSAAKTAALANVLMDAHVTPLAVEREGIGALTPAGMQALAAQRKTVSLVSRARRTKTGFLLQVRPEVLDDIDLLAAPPNKSNILLLDTDEMGTIGTVTIDPGVEQTAYGLLSDLVDIARTL